ncbi:hypothetical protein ACP6L2_17135 [Sphingobacterium lactis]|uniref:hypothetical protein n=1 Tax=Sphingobacterium lactis TaxID=797291 RepID=UPI003F7FEFD5
MKYLKEKTSGFIKEQRGFIRYGKGAAMVLFMVFTAYFFDDREIILPELAALSIGCLVYMNSEWRAKPWDLFKLPTATAIAGFFINMLALPLLVKLIIAIAFTITLLFLAKNFLAPALATALLPIVTNCTSYLFLWSIVFFTLLLAISVLIRDGRSVKNEHSFAVPKLGMMTYGIIILMWFSVCYWTGHIEMAAIPPVIVVGLENAHKSKYTIKTGMRQIVVLSIAALAGSYFFSHIDYPAISVLLSFFTVYSLLRLMKMNLPPAYAMSILPMVLHAVNPVDFSIRVFIMASVIFLSIYLMKKQESKLRSVVQVLRKKPE